MGLFTIIQLCEGEMSKKELHQKSLLFILFEVPKRVIKDSINCCK